jgi:hypothetical protein
VVVLRRLCSVLLLSLWLAASQHCGLDAAGLDFFGHTDHPTGSCETNCPEEECPAIEGGTYTAAASSLRLLAPEAVPPVSDGVRLVPVATALPSGVKPVTAGSEVEAIPRTWCFERRAALPARAPDGSA